MTRKDCIFIGIAAGLAAVVFLNGLQGEFVYDDFHYILNNRQVSGEDSVFGCPTPSDRAYLGLYRPLPVLSYRLNYQISGKSPGPYHGVNIAFHVLVTIALYLFVRAFTGSREGAFLGALLFAAHPVHAEAVSWMVGRAELMAAFFCLLTALFHLGARRSKWFLAPAALSFLAACLSKENAFTFPAILVLADLFLRDGSKGWKRL